MKKTLLAAAIISTSLLSLPAQATTPMPSIEIGENIPCGEYMKAIETPGATTTQIGMFLLKSMRYDVMIRMLTSLQDLPDAAKSAVGARVGVEMTFYCIEYPDSDTHSASEALPNPLF
jgi:hypothetical protein